MRPNINPGEWGESSWVFLKACARGLDPEHLPAYIRLLHLLPELLPCEICRRHCQAYLQQYPPERLLVERQESSVDALCEYLERFHRAAGSGRERSRRSPWGRTWLLFLPVLLVILVLFLSGSLRDCAVCT